MTPETIRNFIEKYVAGNYSEEEHDLFIDWVKTAPLEEVEKLIAFYQGITPAKQEMTDNSELVSQIEAILNQYDKMISQPAGEAERRGVTKVFRLWKPWEVAASILLLIGLGSFFYFFNKSSKPDSEIAKTKPVKNDVEAPKTTKAMIILANGRTVSIDSLTTLTQNNVSLVKTAEDKIVYSGSSSEIAYNTLTNPRGSKVVDVQLSDGSHVWLNAGSSVTYPVVFIGNDRKVEITGEAYFEIAHDAGKPFKISKGETVVTVLGTHFNVNSYDDESDIKVTLLEGSVKINKGTSESILKPRQQAQVTSTINVINGVNIEKVMAWKNGQFILDGTDIKTLMRQVSRWYNVEIAYKGVPAEKEFEGSIGRNVSLSSILRMLEESGVKCELSGNVVMVGN